MGTSTSSNPQPTLEQGKLAAQIAGKLYNLGCEVQICPEVSVGPLVTAYRFRPTGSTKFAQIENLGRDLAIFLGVEDVFVKRLPGESAVAVFVPNANSTQVSFADTLEITKYQSLSSEMAVPLNLGVDYLGRPVVEDLATLPHLLIAGTTGSGKSKLLNILIASMVACKHHRDLKLVVADTQGVEFNHLIGLPNLAFEPATNAAQVIERMEYIVGKMQEHLALFQREKVRNITDHRARFPSIKMAYIVLVLDEIASLLGDKTKIELPDERKTTRARYSEELLLKIVQESRKTGIYVIAATQRPSVDIISGAIKANFPARFALKLFSSTDSRTILDTEGAERLLSRGDGLFMGPRGLQRIHVPWASETEINKVLETTLGR